MILRSHIVFLLLFVFTRGVAQTANTSKKQLQIDSLLKTIYKTDAPGISVSIIEKENLIFKNGYGIADLETKTALNSKTNFNIGSLTKQFTALAILQLAESKKLSLDDHLEKFFPGLDKKVAEIVTVKELLTHSSGIIDHYDLTDTKSLKHAHINDVLNRTPANFAKVIGARKHDAVDFRSVVPFGFIHRTLKRANLVEMLFSFEHLLLAS